MFEGRTIVVIIPAAGAGTRMGSEQPKQFVELAGTPILVHTLHQFALLPEIDTIVIAAAESEMEFVRKLCATPQLSKVREVVAGGTQRQDSVWNALRSLNLQPQDLVLVHDAVRPFVSDRIIRDVYSAATMHGAAVPVVTPKDTIVKLGAEGSVDSTLVRDKLGLVQTPQGFTYSVLMASYEKAYADSYYSTDEASLVRRVGYVVATVQGSYHNLKITTPDDLSLARVMLTGGTIT